MASGTRHLLFTMVVVGPTLACFYDWSLPGQTTTDPDAGSTERPDAVSVADVDVDVDVADCGSVDLTKDPNHCGRCGRRCGGGACVEGRCQPVTLFELPGSPLTVTASADASGPRGLAIDSAWVYVAEFGGKRVARVARPLE